MNSWCLAVLEETNGGLGRQKWQTKSKLIKENNMKKEWDNIMNVMS